MNYSRWKNKFVLKRNTILSPTSLNVIVRAINIIENLLNNVHYGFVVKFNSIQVMDKHHWKLTLICRWTCLRIKGSQNIRCHTLLHYGE